MKSPSLLITAFVFALMYISCEKTAPPSEPDQPGTVQPDSTIGLTLVKTGPPTMDSPLNFCCNNESPSRTYDEYDDAGITWCQGGGLDVISCLECATLWATYNPYEDSALTYRACEGSAGTVPPITGFSGSVQSDHPHLAWDSLYTHYYAIDRKIGNGNWTRVQTIENCNNRDQCSSDETFTDNEISLSSAQYNIYYRIFGRMWDAYYSEAAPQLTFKKALSVSISGPTYLTTIQTGQFTANVSGGCPTYSFKWYKYQECEDGPKNDDPESVPCGSWVLLPVTTQTITQGGFIPGFQLKSVVTDQENDTAIDYHYVTVVLP